FIFVLACLAAAITTTFFLTRNTEPSYHGRTLSQWLRPANPDNLHSYTPEEVEAIRHFGTSAVPYLLTWISYEPSRLRSSLLAVSWKLPRPLQASLNPWLRDKSRVQLADDAWYGFYIIGPQAHTAVPELT